jgi:hypothetical protein
MSSYLNSIETSTLTINKELKINNNIIDVKGKISGFPCGGYLQDVTSVIGGYIYIDKVSDYYYMYIGLADGEVKTGSWTVVNSEWELFNIKNYIKKIAMEMAVVFG